LACTIQGGGRRIVGVIAGSGILMYVVSGGRRRLRAVVIAIVCIGVLLMALEVVLQNRNRGFGDFAYERAQAVDIDDNFLRLCQIIDIIPGAVEYTHFQPIIYAIVRPVPRAIWANKPVDMGFDLASYLGYQDVGFTLSIVGEAYMSWGFAGAIIMGLFMGRLAKMWQALDRIPTLSAAALYSVICMDIFAGLRSVVELILMFYPVLFWLAADGAFRIFLPSKVPAARPRYVALRDT